MAISLEKRTESAGISLQKVLQKAADKGHDLGDVAAQVILVLDYSGSMAQFYDNGQVQELAERVLGLSLSGLDDDGNVQVFPFHNSALEPFVVDVNNYRGAVENWRYVKKGVFGKKVERPMGGTEYSAAINAVHGYLNTNNMLASGKPPVLVIFQTDGGSSSIGRDKKLLTDLSDKPIFWEFIGLGRHTSFLKELDDMPGRFLDNVGQFGVTNITDDTDEEFYDKIVSEFIGKWLPAARAAGIVTS